MPRITRARLADAALALAFTVAGQVEMRVPTSDGYTAGGPVLNTLVLLAVDASLVAWRVAPEWVLGWMATVLVGTSLVTAHDSYFWTCGLPMALVVFRVARFRDGWWARTGWLLAVAASYSNAVHDRPDRALGNLVSPAIVFGAIALGARLLRRHEQQRDRLDATLAELAAEQTHREEAATLLERNRIASETHDVVAHAVSEMVLQVGAARMGLQARDQPVPAQLVAAETTGRQALAELRRSLGIHPDHPDHGLAPVPGLADVGALVDRFRSAGLDVHLSAPDPALARLPTGLQLAVHRVLQESLTNALKHAGAARVDVALARDRADVVLDVRNADRGPMPADLPSGRHGLVGMRERVVLYGGTLETGPDGHGWRVHARWPVPVGASA